MKTEGRKLRRGHKVALATLSLAVMAVAILAGCTSDPSSDPVSVAIDPDWTPPPVAEQAELPDISEVVAKVRPSVVAINTEAITYDIFNQPFAQRGAGSGWIADENGYVVTNSHVVENAETITVTLSDGTVHPADEVRADPFTDVAVLEIDADGLSAASIGDSADLDVGDWVVAIGNSLGLNISATQGIVSSQDVSLSVSPGQTLSELIQTDAAINPGNSGGPLVNMAGEVIGITSAKIAQVGVEGMGYAISINEALPVVEQLIDTGYVVRPWLGVGAATVDSTTASIYGLAVDTGALITEIAEGSPADTAGLQAGDIITSLDGEPVQNAGALIAAIGSREIGETVELTFWRGSEERAAEVTLEESPPPEF